VLDLATSSGLREARLRQIHEELTHRKMEALRLYEPQAEQAAFHASLASERIIRGGNQSGKSLAAFVETARAAVGADPYGKYPTDRPLTIWIFAYNALQIGRTVNRLLFRDGAFYMIQDEVTCQWRAYRPWDPKDRARQKEAKLTPPLIPRRFIDVDGFSWHKKKEAIFSRCELFFGDGHPMNGTEIYAFTSNSEPPQGDPVDLVHIDEDLQYPRYVAELEARLSYRKGRLIWSVFPHNRNTALVDMVKRAEEDSRIENPDVEEFRLTFSGNPYIDDDEKRKRIKGWSPLERKARDDGEFLLDEILMYPTFHIETHGTPQVDAENKPKTRIDDLLASRQVPSDWTRYVVVDPGHGVGAVLFAAVPPPSVGDYVVAYDELYLKHCTDVMFAEEVEKKYTHPFHAFIMDDHFGRQTQAGGKTVMQQYSEELKKRNIASTLTNHGFIRGSDDVPGRCAAVRRWLAIRDDGTTKFRIMKGCLPSMEREFSLYQKVVTNEEAQDRPVKNKNDHLMNCLEYLAAYNPKYVPPPPVKHEKSAAYEAFQEWLKKRKKPFRGGIHLGPGQGAAV
jgi:hypothetical protein